jgi:CheY-like chemotaxis protein
MTFKILIADDEADARVIIKEAVSATLKDTDIVFAGNGNEAIEQCRAQDFDLVIIDLIMPFMNGIESLKVIHMSEPDLPIIVVTGTDDSEMKDEALKSGANLLLEKPLQLDELARAVRHMTGFQE